MSKTTGGKIRIGVGGWVYEPWRGVFYPEKWPQKRELEYASRHLTSLEIDGTYYGSQKPESFARWYDETPDDFVFSPKASRFSTNRKVLASAGESVDRFFASGVTRLKHKLGPIDWQFMATKKFDAGDFEAFLQLLPRSVDGLKLRHAVEVRHASFQTADFIELARKYEVAIVVAGDSKFPQIADPTAPFVYARIMGTTERPKLGYAPKSLDEWVKRARAWAAGETPEGLSCFGTKAERLPRDVYLYVISGHKEKNPAAAMALIERLG